MPYLMESEGRQFPPTLDLLNPFNAQIQRSSSSKGGGRKHIVDELKKVIAAFLQSIANVLYANISAAQSDLRRADNHLSQAILLIERSESGEEANASLACLYHCRGLVALGRNVLESGSVGLDDAVAAFVKSAELDPFAETYFRLGQAHARAGNHEEAIESLEKATDLDPNYAEAYLLKGIIHQRRGELDDAHEGIYWAVAINPDLYREEFAPIMQAEKESEAVWDELLNRPESQAMLKEWGEEALEALEAGQR